LLGGEAVQQAQFNSCEKKENDDPYILEYSAHSRSVTDRDELPISQ
jgi:hypothetical protein